MKKEFNSPESLSRELDALRRENELLSRTIDNLTRVIDAWGLRQIIDRWEQERELLSILPAQRN